MKKMQRTIPTGVVLYFLLSIWECYIIVNDQALTLFVYNFISNNQTRYFFWYFYSYTSPEQSHLKGLNEISEKMIMAPDYFNSCENHLNENSYHFLSSNHWSLNEDFESIEWEQIFTKVAEKIFHSHKCKKINQISIWMLMIPARMSARYTPKNIQFF